MHCAARWKVSPKPEMCYVHSNTVHKRILSKEHNIININKCVHTAQFHILCTDCTKIIYYIAQFLIFNLINKILSIIIFLTFLMDKFVIRTVNAIYAKIANFRISPPQISNANFAMSIPKYLSYVELTLNYCIWHILNKTLDSNSKVFNFNASKYSISSACHTVRTK